MKLFKYFTLLTISVLLSYFSNGQNCPDYANTATGSGEACGGQNYTMTVANTTCNGEIYFDVIGNFGSQYAYEITWEVVSVQSGAVVASGGPGFNGGAINVTVGPLDPNIHGNVFDLFVFDSYGDGFNGFGGFVQTEQGGNVLANINGNFGDEAHVLFNANISISPATITVNTPSGNIVETVNSCNDFITQVPLNNANFCNTINVNLPWTITCDATGATLASGNHNVTVYPEVPTDASDVVEITWNTSTCSWDVDAQNDCDALDIGNVFNILPDPNGLSTNACTNGTQDFTIDYLGLPGSPNCCATAGPLVPITYNDVLSSNDANAQDSPFGGQNNSAFINFPPNNSGGNATSLDLCFDMTNFCFNPPSFSTDTDFFVFIFVDGNQVYQAGPLTGTSHSVCIDLTDIPGGYTQSSDIEIYTLPNLFSFNGSNTNFDPNANCGSITDGEWTADFNVTLDVTFDQMIGSPVSCSFDITEPHTCCSNTNLSASNPPPINVQCAADVPAPNPAVVDDETSDCSTAPTVTFVNDVSNGNTCPEIITRTYEVEDQCGNTIQVEQTITINDTQAPTITGSIATSNINGCSAADAPAAETTVAGIEGLGVTIGDNCTSDANLNVTSNDVSVGTCPITVTRTYTIEDECGNTETIDHVITIDDTQAPTVTGTIATSNITGCSVADAPAAETTVAGVEGLGVTIGDNCTADANLNVSSNDVSSGTCPVVLTRTYTIEDECGNTETVDHIINIDDTQAPTITGTITTSNITGCAVTDAPAAETTVAGVEGLGVTINDNCTSDANLNVSSNDVSAGTCPIVVTRTYTIEDECGNTETVDHVISIDDTQAPTVTGTIAASNITGCSVADAPAAETTVAGIEGLGVTINDNCTADANLNVSSNDVSAGTCPIVITRTYTIEDECGNTETVGHIININDTQAPTITGAIPQTNINGCVISGAPAAETTVAGIEALGVTINDNCTADANLSVSSNDVSAGTCPLVITRTYTIEDECGNTETIDHIINIGDTQAPTITGTITSTNINGCVISGAPPAETTATGIESLGVTIDDNCTSDADLVVSSNDVSAGTCPLVITRTYTIEDECGNTETIDHVINIGDTQAPTITGAIATSNITGCSAADAPAAENSVADIEANLGITIDDNCTNDADLTVSSNDVSAGTCPIVITRTYTIEDDCGNTETVDHVININDTDAPTITGTIAASNITGCSVADAPAAETTVAGIEGLGVTINDNCTADGNLNVSSNDVSAGTCPIVLTRTYTIEDECGNTETVDHVINIDDTQAPTVTGTIATSNITGCSVADAPAAETTVAGVEGLGITIGDNCTADANLNVSSNDVSSGTCPVVLTRTYTIEDECGNTETVDHVINIDDTQAPTVTGTIATSSITGCSVADAPAAETTVAGIEGLGVTINDNCTADANLNVSANDVSAGTCPIVLTRTYTIEDECGNTETVDHVINIDDNQNPTASNPAPISATGSAPAPDITVVTDEADNCTVNPTVAFVSDVSDNNVCPETVTRTYSVTDECGNSINVTQTITIGDAISPTASNPAVINVQCTSDIPAPDPTVVTDENDNGAPPVVTWEDDTSDGLSCPETIARRYRVTDDCGNFIFVTQNIIINDTQAPTVVGTTTSSNIAGCSIADAPAAETTVAGIEALGVTIDDNCTADADLSVSSNDVSAGTCPIVVTRTYTIEDECGNTETVDHVININDTDAPIINGTITASNINGCSAADAPAAENSVTDIEANLGITIDDNCTADANLIVSSNDVAAGTCPIVVTRTYTIEDECGNTETVDHVININDTDTPIINGAITASNINGCSAADAPAAESSVADIEANLGITIDDNCTTDANLIVSSNDVAAGTCPIVVTRTYSIEDECGNTETVDHVININDTDAPIINGTITASNINGCSAADAPAAESSVADIEANLGITIDDNCTADANLIVSSNDVATGTCPIVVTRTYTIEDECGNTETVDHVININDTQDPTASNPAPVTVECLSDVPSIDITVVNDEADNCTATPTVAHVSDVSDNNTCNGEIITRTYSVTDDCGNSINVTQTITIDSYTPTFSINGTDPSICGNSDGFITISGLDPNTDYIFEYDGNAAITITTDASGEHVITGLSAGTYTSFTISDIDCPSCATTDGASITLNDPNPPTIGAGNDQTVCEGDQITLTANNPDGANITWDNGVTDGVTFTPPVGTTTYEVEAELNGCTSTDQVIVTVNPLPNPVIDPVSDLCVAGNSITLTANPAGGTFSGNGVTGTDFDPNAAGVGTHTITYDYTDGNGCNNSTTIDINVTPSPTPVIDPVTDLCIDAGVITLTANPAGGTFSGNGIIAGTDDFDPNAAGVGTHTITYDYTDAGGCSGSTTIDINVNGLPTPTIDPVADLCVDAPVVTLVGNPAGGTFSGNGVTGTDFDPNTAGVGTHTITYDYTDGNGCSASTTIDVSVLPLPTVGAGNNQDICEGDQATLIANNPDGATITWDNGVTNGVAFTPPVGNNTYEVTADLNGCTTTDHVVINVNPLPTFNLAPSDPTTCGGSDGFITISGLDPNTNYDITYDDSGNPIGPNTIMSDASGDIVINGLSSSSYSNFIVSVSASGCTTIDNSSFNLADPNAPAVNAGPDQVICNDGSQVTLTAGNPDGANISWDNGVTDGIAFTPANTGNNTYTVTADLNGCTSSDQVIVTVNPLPSVVANASDINICDGESITLFGSGADSYNWDNGVTDNAPFTPNSTTTYNVTGTDNNGCQNTDQVTITVNPEPNVNFTAPETSGCTPLEVNFSSNSPNAVSCEWDFGDGSSALGCNGISHEYVSTGCFDVTLTVTDNSGCSNSNTVTDFVCVDNEPFADFAQNFNTVSEPQTEVQFTNASVGAENYIWNFYDDFSTTEVNPNHDFPFEPGNYVVTLTAISENGCRDTKESVVIVEEDLIFYVPNTFTPDGNDFNEIFKPVMTSGYDPFKYTLLIFNRWGEPLFESHNADIGWDGTYQGSLVQDGTYVWKISIHDPKTDERKEFTGHVNVLR